LIRPPEIEGILDIVGHGRTPAKRGTVIIVGDTTDLNRTRPLMALKAEIVGLACRISGGEQHQPVRIVPTNSVVKGVMAVRTRSYVVPLIFWRA
jgi:hypothetical protein